MADVAISIRSYLLTKTVVTDIVGTRIYADKLPQTATLPAIEMTIVSDVPEMELNDLAGLTKARVQLACIATKRTTARSLAQAIRTCGIATIKGLYTSVQIRGVAVADTFDSLLQPTDGSDESRYQTAVDLLVDYWEQ